MKILILSYEFPPIVGGAATYVGELALSLHNLDHIVHVVTCIHGSRSKSAEYDETMVTKNGLFIKRFKPYGKLFFVQMFLITKKYIHKDYDQIILADARAIKFAAYFFSMELLHKCTNIFHGGQVENIIENPSFLLRLGKINKSFIAYLLSCNVNIAVSQFLRNSFLQKEPSLARKIKVVYHGIDETVFYPLSQQEIIRIRKEYNFKLNDIIIISTSRLDKDKGQDYLLSVFRDLVVEAPNLKLVIVGDGIAKKELMEKSKYYRLGEKVVFINSMSRKALAKLIGSSDLAVMLSRIPYEAFGLVNIEANACGIPVLASKYAGVRESVEDGISGLLVDPFDLSKIREKLSQLLVSDRRKKLGKTAYQYCIKKHTAKIMAMNTIQAIQHNP